jgi:uncharacterized protein YndB with AHSA1/START domain
MTAQTSIKHTYVYVTYIVSTPQKVWEALTDAKISASYWERENVSDWKVGSRWTHGFAGKAPDVVGRVIEADPPRKLVTTWLSPAHEDQPEFANPCTFLIEDVGGKVKLTVTHENLSDQDLKNISGGWPAVLSNLKTMLETGKTIPNPFSAVAGHPEG